MARSVQRKTILSAPIARLSVGFALVQLKNLEEQLSRLTELWQNFWTSTVSLVYFLLPTAANNHIT